MTPRSTRRARLAAGTLAAGTLAAGTLAVATAAGTACTPAAHPAVGAAGGSRVDPAPAGRDTAALAALGPDELRRDLTAFAADAFRGRRTGTPDADRAAHFLAARLAALGVEPAGDSGYFHRVPLRRERFTARLTGPAGAATLRVGTELLVVTSLGSGAPLPALAADAEVVFAGYGIVDPALGRDDLAGLDVAGKVVVVVNDAPPGLAGPAARAPYTGGRGFTARVESLVRRRPAAVVLLVKDGLFAVLGAQFAERLVPADDAHPGAAEPRPLPLVAVAPLRPGAPFLPGDWPANPRARALPGTRLAVRRAADRPAFHAYNVVGVVRGRDPALRASYVAYGAHYDHIGIQPAAGGDSVANGADDDGSGVSALLAVAGAFQRGPRPRRSLLFVWHVGEEDGLFGSARFVERPTVPLDSVVAQLNADMVGRNAPDSLHVVGPGAAPGGQSRRLGAVVDAVNAALPRPFAFDRAWDTPAHPERIYYRSDHYSYARRRVPVAFFTSGLHADYHEVTDHADKIDYDKLARVSRLLYETGATLANSVERVWPPRARGAPAAAAAPAR